MMKVIFHMDTDTKDTKCVTPHTLLQTKDFDKPYDRPMESERGREGVGMPPNSGKVRPSEGFGILSVSKKSINFPGSEKNFEDVPRC